MPKIFFSLFVFLLGSLTFTSAQNTIDLSGEWQVILETNHELEEQYPNSFNGTGKIELPASLAEKGFGYRTYFDAEENVHPVIEVFDRFTRH